MLVFNLLHQAYTTYYFHRSIMEDPQGVRPTISDDNIDYYSDSGLIGPVVRNKRKVSAALLSSPSSDRFCAALKALSVAERISPVSFSATSYAQAVDFVELPANVRSAETYEFLGFNRETAQSLWERYLKYYVEMSDIGSGFFCYAQWHVEVYNGSIQADVTTGTEDWDGLMKELGLNENFRTAMMLPRFADIRYTASCKFWILDAIKMQYAALKALDGELRGSQARHHHPTNASMPSLHHTSTASTTEMAKESKISPRPDVAKLAEDAPSALEGHHMLWQAGDHGKHLRFYNENNENSDTINIWALSSSGDFSIFDGTYLTPQKELADRYAEWAKAKAPIAKVTAAQVAVPFAFTSLLTTEYLNGPPPTDEQPAQFGPPPIANIWQDLVFYNRRGKRLPEDLNYIGETELLIGDVASARYWNYENLVCPERIKYEDILKVNIGGQKARALQWVFQFQDGTTERAFNEVCKGKVWIHQLGRFKVPKMKE